MVFCKSGKKLDLKVLMPESVQSNDGHLMLDRYLFIVWIIEEDIFIFYDANKVVEDLDSEIRSEELGVVALVFIHKQLQVGISLW